MKARSNQSHPSTKFSVLTDAESIARARRNCLTLIIIATLLICASAVFLIYKIFVAPVSLSQQTSQSSNYNNSITVKHQKSPLFKYYNPAPMLLKLRKRKKDKAELACGDFQTQEAIPLIYREQIFQNDFENLHDFINFDLILHYDNIMNEYPAESLNLIFKQYQYKLLYVKNSQDFEDFLTVLKSNKFKFYAAQMKVKKYDLKLAHFESYFALTDELSHWYNFLDRLPAFLSSYEEVRVRKYIKGCEETNFEKFAEEIQKGLYPFAYPFKVSEKKLAEINGIINEWAQPLKIDFHNCAIFFYNKAITLSDVNTKILGLNNSCLKNVYVFASHTIYLDEDLELVGVNLALIAPNWVFLKRIKINLDGEAGRNHTKESYDPLQPGEPGKPGGNAGDFIGVGNFIEKFLLISANGGKGGNGQNGAKGHDGVDHTPPGPPLNKPTCVSKIKIFNNSFGEIITHYAVYNEKGCGGSGGNGGVGGVGGTGGVITLINKNNMKIIKGLKGASGIPGKGGAGGVGGKNGCFYDVLDVNDEILHVVTRIKCPVDNILPSGEFGKDNNNFMGQILPPVKENISLHKCFLQFFQYAGDDFIKHNDHKILTFLKEIAQHDLFNKLNLTDIINEYKVFEQFERIELYRIFNEKMKYIQTVNYTNGEELTLKYLKSVVLGKMLILKKNVDFFFIDLKNYLKFLRRNIIITNMNIPENQSLWHFKKVVGIKCEQVKLNLERIRVRLTALYLRGSGRPYEKGLSKKIEETRILCILMATVDVYFLITRNSKDKNLTGLNALSSNKVVGNNTKIKSSIADAEKILFKVVENLENEEEVKYHLVKLKNTLCLLKDSDALSVAARNLLEALIQELEHFITLYYFIEWENLEGAFSKSLDDIVLNKSSNFEESKELKFLKRQLVDIVVAVQYNLAVNAVRQRSMPFMNNTQQFLQKEITSSNVLTQIDILEDIANEDLDPFCKNHLKAVFNKGSAVGEFYFWPNSEIRHKLKYLLSGAEVNLEAKLLNRHVFDKNFVKFTSLKLEFECCENASLGQKHLNEVLLNFKLEITHSGYSYYNWKGETQIVVSEKVSLNYSFKMKDNKEPEVYNSLFKKCQNGEIKLSPFTTWSVRLLPLNDDADFTKLTPFSDTVNLRLVGTGTYIS